MKSRIVAIGSGGFAVNCLKVMLGHDRASIALVVADPRALSMRGLLQSFCARASLPCIESTDVNSGSTINAIRSAEPDFVCSIYNMQILKRELLGIPKIGTVNFHNGPLPRYRGVNLYSWAIINGESEYGVTWHLVDDGIDTGDILAQKTFSLSPDDKPATLVAKGFKAGVESLAELFPALLAGDVKPRGQDSSLATYYSRRDTPNGGRIDFGWPVERIERLVRGLDFRPLRNTFVYPTASFRGADFHPQAVRLLGGSVNGSPAEVLSVDETLVHVQASNGVVGLCDILGPDHTPITSRELQTKLGFRVGDRLQ